MLTHIMGVFRNKQLSPVPSYQYQYITLYLLSESSLKYMIFSGRDQEGPQLEL